MGTSIYCFSSSSECPFLLRCISISTDLSAKLLCCFYESHYVLALYSIIQ